LARDHYKIKLDNPKDIREIEYEKFDYNIIKPNLNPFANSLVNEMWPFFRMLWRTRGGYTAEIKFNPDIDLTEFGSQFGPGMYTALFKFKIDRDGKWEADFDFEFKQIDNPYDDRLPRPWGRKGPFYAQDYSRMISNTATRARKLAKPTWGVDGRNGQDFSDLLKEEEHLNRHVNLSFKHRYQGTGDWGNFADYAVEVSNESTVVIPEKEEMTFPQETTISVFDIKRRPKDN
jgi:hypothetical protein